jgi:hypothetical protein
VPSKASEAATGTAHACFYEEKGSEGTIPSEEGDMPFNLASSWIAAGALSLVMLVLGLRNRRNGWRRKRQDVVLDNLTLWASTVAKPAPPMKPAVQATASLTSDLAALHTALGTANPVSAPAEESTVRGG